MSHRHRCEICQGSTYRSCRKCMMEEEEKEEETFDVDAWISEYFIKDFILPYLADYPDLLKEYETIHEEIVTFLKEPIKSQEKGGALSSDAVAEIVNSQLDKDYYKLRSARISEIYSVIFPK